MKRVGWVIVYGNKNEQPRIEWRAFAPTRNRAWAALREAWGAQNVAHWRDVMVVKAIKVSISLEAA